MNASFWNYPSKQKSWPIDEEMESLGEVIHPLDNIGGFDVRPGFYQIEEQKRSCIDKMMRYMK